MIDATSQIINGQSAWNNLSAAQLLNSWVPYGSGWQFPSYCIDFLGWVHLRGLLSATTVGGGGPAIALPSTMFVLPVGFRPSRNEMLTAVIYDGTHEVVGRLDVFPDGSVTIENLNGSVVTTAIFVSWGNVSFNVNQN